MKYSALALLCALPCWPALAAPKPPCDTSPGAPYPSPVECVIATYPDPAGGSIDLLDWLAPDPSLRGVTYMMPGKIAGHVVNDKIIYTKFGLGGDNWDSWTFDDDYVYFYSTGNLTDFVKSVSEHNTPWLPRYAQLGFPGVRLVTEGSAWRQSVSCVLGDPSPFSNSIMELHGPTMKTYAGLGLVETIEVKTWWDCHGTDISSCTAEEDYTYAKPYGWIEWEHFEALTRDGNFTWKNGGPFSTLEHGDSVIQDWCISPSIFTPAGQRSFRGPVLDNLPRLVPKRHPRLEVTFSGACTAGGPVITAHNGSVPVSLEWQLVAPPSDRYPSGDTWSDTTFLAPGEGEEWASGPYVPSLYLIWTSTDEDGRVHTDSWSQSCPIK